ncbi:MAG: response regulator transcription factor [Armatimonadota bacterium]|nr:response regulator transcription factor [Armatimonadota bacterium]MDW8156364.1 response regulator transcription factor [Armatimonadota bacterium]
MAAGARGLVPKDAPPDVLVRAVASGGWFVQGPAGAPRFEGLRCLARAGPLDGPVPKLTPRDQGVLRLIVCGLTDAQIARTLHVATPTVKNQLRKLYQRLAARHRAQAVARAVVLGLLEEGL